MGRLIGISNRTAAGKAKAGGLAVALWDALTRYSGVWFGWSGNTVPDSPRGLHMEFEENVEYALTDLSEEEHQGYYLGFSNRALWPVLHYRVDLANFDEREFGIYAEVNERFARLVYPRLREDDVVWVHDYHFMLLGQGLRNAGWNGRIGYFLHVPFPPPEIFMSLPDHGRLVRGLCAFDVIGTQTEVDRRNLEQYILDQLGGRRREDGDIDVLGRKVRVRAYPIGIAAEEFASLVGCDAAKSAVEKLSRFLGRRGLILGVDRMDYSKGIPHRFEAVGRLLDHYPELRGEIAYTQVAPPSRSKVEEYKVLRQQLDQLAGRVNGDYGDLDWIPIRYLARPYPREALAGVYRLARVGLVTPLHDGMNLVAKEFVAAQNPEDPGVLLLSQFAGAAEQLGEGAVMVNPHDITGMADAIKRALEMPAAERRDRWQLMNRVVHEQDIDWWRTAFLADLGIGEPAEGDENRKGAIA